MKWPNGVLREKIGSNEVHVWSVYLNEVEFQTKGLFDLLSTDEIDKLHRFHNEKDQKRYIVSRGLLRNILAGYLGKDPAQLRFEYSDTGKPTLLASASNDNLHFNLSHTRGLVLYAFALDRFIGIDVEYINDQIEYKLIADKFFSPGEIYDLEKTGEQKRKEKFFQLWTRKEALLKATGAGIGYPMEQLDVSECCGSNWSSFNLPFEKFEKRLWHIRDLFPGVGYTAAIAVKDPSCVLSCWNYTL
jgi:4'-phosphopantetheinyl transferase